MDCIIIKSDIKKFIENNMSNDIKFYKTIANHKIDNEDLIKFYNNVLFEFRHYDKNVVGLVNKVLFQNWTIVVNKVIEEYSKYLINSSKKLETLYNYSNEFLTNKNINKDKKVNNKPLEEMTKEELINYIKNKR